MNHLSSKLKIQKSQTDIREQIQTVKYPTHTHTGDTHQIGYRKSVSERHRITAFMISHIGYTAFQISLVLVTWFIPHSPEHYIPSVSHTHKHTHDM